METNRIILRPWRDSDAEVLYMWASDPDVGPRAGWAPHQTVRCFIIVNVCCSLSFYACKYTKHSANSMKILRGKYKF